MPVNIQKLGRLRTQIGTVNGNQLRFLAFVKECDRENCPLSEVCPFEESGRCTVIQRFLSSFYSDWVDPKNGIGDRLNQIELDRIGMLIMPLCHQLIKVEMEIYNLAEMSYKNEKGGWAEYPQYSAQRAIISKISAELKTLDLVKKWDDKFQGKKGLPDAKSIGRIMREGQPGGYEEAMGMNKQDE